MGYQVGNHCYATKQEAENVYFSLVAPVISANSTNSTTTTSNNRPPIGTTNRPAPTTAKATLIKPEYQNGKWTLQGQTITANLPTCDIAQNIRDGSELGWAVFGIMAAMYLFVILKRQLR